MAYGIGDAVGYVSDGWGRVGPTAREHQAPFVRADGQTCIINHGVRAETKKPALERAFIGLEDAQQCQKQ